ncbi:hypothetical protein SBOR_1120 [Sclerotinia borealis F-4128]|uniref:Uncharacterized protein n=1 Tax=Sclerotinia borealis (strain F-4128) TaxID=1432307 RepID=W9CQW2_SCLBF|nr:hypothetical protein SBOR_1120 [Sclerotinia borealis F-4128]
MLKKKSFRMFEDSDNSEPGILMGNEEIHATKSASASASESLFQIPSSNESVASTGSEEVRSLDTTNVTISVSPPHCSCEHILLSNNEYQSTTTTTSVGSTPKRLLNNKSSSLTGSQHPYQSPTRDFADQQHSSRASRTVVRSHQPSHNSKSPSLTGSQDSLIPVSPARILVDLPRNTRASQPVLRTHAEKLRAALACPIDELPQAKLKSPKKTPLKKKMGSLWRKVQHKFEKPLVANNHQLITSKDE